MHSGAHFIQSEHMHEQRQHQDPGHLPPEIPSIPNPQPDIEPAQRPGPEFPVPEPDIDTPEGPAGPEIIPEPSAPEYVPPAEAPK